MYLHRYPHIQRTHTDINSTHRSAHTQTVHIPTRKNSSSGEISQSVVLTSLQSSLHSHRCGATLKSTSSNQMSTIIMCLSLHASFPQMHAKILENNMSYFAGYYGSRSGCILFLPDKMVQQGHYKVVPKCSLLLNDSSCTKTSDE